MVAYVLIKTKVGRSKSLVERLQTLEGVEEAAAVYGGVDVVAKIEVEDEIALSRLVIDHIQALPAVESTQTLIAIEGMTYSPE